MDILKYIHKTVTQSLQRNNFARKRDSIAFRWNRLQTRNRHLMPEPKFQYVYTKFRRHIKIQYFLSSSFFLLHSKQHRLEDWDTRFRISLTIKIYLENPAITCKKNTAKFFSTKFQEVSNAKKQEKYNRMAQKLLVLL